MRKNTLNKLAVILGVLVLFSCKSKKHLIVDRRADTTIVSTDTVKKITDTANTAAKSTTAIAVSKTLVPIKMPIDNFKLAKLRAIRLKQLDFNTFSGKAQTKLNVNGDSHDVTLNIRIKKNQQIWVSVTAVLGVEVARALITPDSIKLMDRLGATYLKKPFSYVYAYTSKRINYKTLESLLVGNAVPELLSDDAAMKPDNGNVVINGNLMDLTYQLVVGPDLRVSQTNMTNSAAAQSLQVSNAAFIQSGSRVLPSQISISSSSGVKKIQADLHYTKVDFDQNLSYPFTVPARFTLVK